MASRKAFHILPDPLIARPFAHFFSSILAKSALDIFFGSSGGWDEVAGEFWTIPFSALATGLLCRCNARGIMESCVLPFPRLENKK